MISDIKMKKNLSTLVHRNGLFSETTAPMVLKFLMQHDQTSGLQNDKIPFGRESKMAADAKNS